jgi:hypothetical protein
MLAQKLKTRIEMFIKCILKSLFLSNYLSLPILINWSALGYNKYFFMIQWSPETTDV